MPNRDSDPGFFPAAAPPDFAVAVASDLRTLFDRIGKRDARILVALSGGPDSCALLLALIDAARSDLIPGRVVTAAHFHHGMRAQDADGDAAFCAVLCARLRVPLVIGLGAVPAARAAAATADHRPSPNHAARTARYDFLERAALECAADVIVTGHTASDQAETVLQRVFRGTGVDGLSGIPARRTLGNGIEVLRPMRNQTRADVDEYCARSGITARQDPSNLKGDYTRSRVRRVLPALARDFNPRLPEALCRLGEAAALDADFIDGFVEPIWHRLVQRSPNRVRIDGALRDTHPALQRRVLLRALQRVSGDAREAAATAANMGILSECLRNGSGAMDLSGGIRAIFDTGFLILSRSPSVNSPDRSIAPVCLSLSIPGRLVVFEAQIDLRASLVTVQEASASRQRRRAGTIYCHYGTIRPDQIEPLTVRSFRRGDRIAPLGMRGKTRLVREVIADSGWKLQKTDAYPLLLVDSADTERVLWIVGLVQAEATRVPDDACGPVLRLDAIPFC